VASIPVSGAQRPTAQQSPSAAVSSGPPGVTVPAGASAALETRIYGDYGRCLLAHHDPDVSAANPAKINQYPADSAGRAAMRACADLQPHPPWQEMAAYNPNFKLDQAKWVNCMIAGGLKIDVTPTGWGVADSDVSQAMSPAGGALMLRCEKRAFGD
jgi:hypothetical protein